MIILTILLLLTLNLLVLGIDDNEIIINIALSLSSHYYSKCIKILYHSNATGNEWQQFFRIFKMVALKSEKTTGFYPYERYIRLRDDGITVGTCSNPFKIILGGKKSQKEFTELTYKYSMGNAVWLIVLDSSVSEFFSNANLPFNARIITAVIRNEDLVEFQEVYRVDERYPIRIVNHGKWTKSQGLDIDKNNIYSRRSDLEGLVLRTGSIENWPMSTFRDGKWDGYFPTIWKEIEVLVNCSSVNFRSIDNSTGIQEPNGDWNGLVGMAVRNEIDVIVSELSINHERSSILDFAHPLYTSRYQIYYRVSGSNLEWLAVLKPFPGTIWLAILIWIVAGTLGLTICHYVSYFYGLEGSKINMFGPIDSFFFMLQTLCQQGYAKAPKQVSYRIIFLGSYLMSAVLIPSYSASLISSLALHSPTRPFDSLTEMLSNGRYKLAVGKNTAEYTYFSKANDTLYKNIFEKLIKTVPEKYVFNTTSDHMDEILCHSSRIALFGVDEIIKMKTEGTRLSCDVLPFSRPLSKVHQSFGFVKNSPYSRLINHQLQRMFDCGVIDRIQSRILPKGKLDSYVPYNEVNVNEIFQIFVFLLFGIFVAVMFLIGEIIFFSNRKKDNKVTMKKAYLKRNRGYVIRLNFYIE